MKRSRNAIFFPILITIFCFGVIVALAAQIPSSSSASSTTATVNGQKAPRADRLEVCFTVQMQTRRTSPSRLALEVVVDFRFLSAVTIFSVTKQRRLTSNLASLLFAIVCSSIIFLGIDEPSESRPRKSFLTSPYHCQLASNLAYIMSCSSLLSSLCLSRVCYFYSLLFYQILVNFSFQNITKLSRIRQAWQSAQLQLALCPVQRSAITDSRGRLVV